MEREQTDESLRLERKKADSVLLDKTALEDAADSVIEKARARADEIVSSERSRTDHAARTRGGGRAPAEAAHVARERRVADEILKNDRAEADKMLRTERAESNELLAQERGATDEDLSVERARSDDAVATRDDFLGIVSHDLRNLLSAVIGFAALIAKAEDNSVPRSRSHSSDVLAYARRIERSGGRMNRLIGDLVDVASIEAGTLAVTREGGDPRDVVSEVIETFEAHASGCGITLTSELATGPMHASFDPARVLQVLANLVGNAVKFTARGGRVVVRLLRERDDVRFEVSDTGVGIATSDLDAVFERFHQVNKADRRGAGLGLYISKCIVQGHGGRIGVHSRPNEGSTFWFTLPFGTTA